LNIANIAKYPPSCRHRVDQKKKKVLANSENG